jgi:hypothetical protein
MNLNGQNSAVNVEAGGALFADGPGAAFAIAALPLVENFATTFRNFGVQQ